MLQRPSSSAAGLSGVLSPNTLVDALQLSCRVAGRLRT